MMIASSESFRRHDRWCSVRSSNLRAVLFVCVGVLAGRQSFAQSSAATASQQAGLIKSAAAPSTTAAIKAVEPASGDGDYVIGADDLLSVVFWRDQQLSSDVLVRPDGKISLPLIDDVAAAGLTPRQLRDRLLVEARRYVTEPIVTVVVKQINSRKVYITGQIVRPGQYALTPSMTILQLIATAGGLGDYAKAKDIKVVRVENGKPVTLHFDYENVTKPSTKTRNVELKSGDTVIVP
jgi:polysaccharide biosynthesis/export protein